MLKTFLGRLNEGWLTFRGREEGAGARPIEQYFPANGGSPHTPKRGALPHAPFAGPHIPYTGPSWPQFYMGLVFAIKERSKDARTKHATILVDRFWRPISFGVNGFVPGIDDSLVPNFDSTKYPFVDGNHSENNAIRNARIDLKSETGVKAFVSGECCLRCFSDLLSNNILEIYMAKRKGYSNGEPELHRQIKDFYILQKGVKVYYMDLGEVEWVRNISFD